MSVTYGRGGPEDDMPVVPVVLESTRLKPPVSVAVSQTLPEMQECRTSPRTKVAVGRFTIVMVAVCLIFVLIDLDSTIPAIAIPNLTHHFGTMADIGWYLSVYRLMSGSFQPLFGKLYSVLPAKSLVLASLLLFLAGALLTALAPSSPVFILGRAISGCATAGITSGAFAIIIKLTPLRSRSNYAGIAAAAEAAASLSAPLVGGVLVDRLSWRWCFFIEMPLVGLTFITLALFLETAKPKVARENALELGFASAFKEIIHRVDVVGTALFVPAFTLLILSLQWGGSVHEWSDWRVLLPLAASVVLLCAFAYVQRGAGDRGTLPPRIVSRRNILFGFLFASCNNGALSVIEYYMPIYFQTVRGLSATTSGIMVLPTGAGLIVSVALAGFMTSYFGYYNPFMIMTGLLLPTATGLLTTVGTGTKTWRLILFQALLGFGSGIGFQGPQVAAQAVLSDADSQIGIAIMQLAQALGPAVGVAAAQNIFASGLRGADGRTAYYSLSHRVVSMSAGGEGGSKGDTPSEEYSAALSDMFYLPLCMACVTLIGALGMEWRSVKKERGRE